MKKITITIDGKEIEASIKDSDFKENFKEKQWPQNNDLFFYLDVDMEILEDQVRADYKKEGEIFKTKEHAELYKKYLEYCAIVPDGVKGEELWAYSYHSEYIEEITDDWEHFLMVKKFATKGSCEAANLEQYRECIEFVMQRKY